jgi:hypothetical protein
MAPGLKVGAAAALLAGTALGYTAWQAKGGASPRPEVSASGRTSSSRPEPGTGGTRFVDATAASGVRFRHDRASSGQRYFVETMGAGVAFIDYDNDGLQDLFFVNGAPLPGYKPRGPMLPALYRNLGAPGGHPKFQDVTRKAGLAVTSYGMGTAVGDYDNDGWDDLYVTAVLGPSHLFHNRGNGTFEEVAEKAGVRNSQRFGTSAAWLDYNKDGKLDLLVCDYVKYNSVKDDLPCYFKEHIRSYCIPFAYQAEGPRLYRNDGGGRFTDVSKAAGVDKSGKSLAVGVADVDRDSWPDVIIANDTTPTHFYHNNGDGTFIEQAAALSIAYGPVGTAKAGMGVDTADVGNDGGVSVAMGNFSAEMAGYYEWTPQGFFEERSIASGLGQPSRNFLTFGTLFFDADNDGWKDLALGNGHVQDNVDLFYDDVTYKQRPLLFRNVGDHKFEEIGLSAGPAMAEKVVARGFARGDLDNDGRIDLVVNENNGPAHLWRNETEGGHWLTVRLQGVKSNRNGFGSRLILSAGGVKQTAELQSGSSYLSQSDQRVHFGLGKAQKVDSLEIRWPSGAVDTLSSLDPDRILTVKEGVSGH